MAGVRIDHPGFVVSDLGAAVQFLTEVLGFAQIRNGQLLDPDGGDLLMRQFGVPAGATADFAFVDLAGSQIELLQWHSVSTGSAAGNSDAGGRHLAIVVDNLSEILMKIAETEGAVIRETHPRGFVYIAMPFGLELQLIPA